MANDFEGAKDLFKWNERVFAIMGVWPLQSTYAKFTVWLVYHIIHMSAVTADFCDVFGNLDLMIPNVSENGWNLMIMAKMLVMRYSRTLAKLTERVVDDVNAEFFKSPEEMERYLIYNRVAKRFFKLWILMGILTSIAMHIKPLEVLLRAGKFHNVGSQNESMVVLDLPYRTRLFFEINDMSTYWFMWIYQLPVMYFNTFQTATTGYLFSLILHVCGLMSVLAFRIKNIDLDCRDDNEYIKTVFHDIVDRHRNILGMVKDINEVFSLLLLEELLLSTLLIGLTSYNIILNIDTAEKTVILTSILECLTMTFYIYGYCVAGEYLIAESLNVYESYYQCRWYDMSDSVKKQLIICMIGACKPIQLMAGGFYIFSLVSFTGVVKTAAGYISMLRAIV